MVNLNEIIEATTPLKVEFNGFTINCEVRLNAVTSDYYHSVKGSDDVGLKLLEKSIAKWDIADGKTILSVNEANLRKLPMTLIEHFGDVILAKRDELKKQS